jgi:SAM-dependent methyltransferase
MNRRNALAGIGGSVALGACGAFDRIPIRPPDAPYVTTREDVVFGMLKLANVGPDDMVYDLGCGDGRIPIMAAQKFGARGLGVEIDPVLVRTGQDNAARAGVSDRVQFRLEDLFKTDVRPATVVALYLLPEMMEKLKFTLRAQLRPGARVVSHEFSWGGDWPPDRSEKVGTTTIHLWQVRK